MREDLLHFIWKYKRLPLLDLVTSNEEPISIIDVGLQNHLSGPDFFNAQIRIGEQLWAGNVEIHVKSSDWYVHAHEEDPKYQNVILHVVWEDDAQVFRKDGSTVPTLELKQYVSHKLLSTYRNLYDKRKYSFINCEASISEVDDFLLQNWRTRLYFERLEDKSGLIFDLLEKSRNDWEQVLFIMLLKNFGLKINGEAFLSLSKALKFSVIRKLRSNTLYLESVLFGMSHLLEDDSIVDTYYLDLKKEFRFLRHKFGLVSDGVLRPEFFKLRPFNFPTIRLSQLANLLYAHGSLFELLIYSNDLKTIRAIFEISASGYWNNHFTFGKVSKGSPKKLAGKFIDLLIINTILPLKYCHSRYLGKDDSDTILNIVTQIKQENNSIVSSFENHGCTIKNAMESQATLQLYNEYCTKNRCLECAVGNSLLNGND